MFHKCTPNYTKLPLFSPAGQTNKFDFELFRKHFHWSAYYLSIFL